MVAANWGQSCWNLFDCALGLPPQRRGAFLRDACGANTALLGELESLLVSYEQASRFLETPAIDIAEPPASEDELMVPGLFFGPYRIIALLGAGGLGEVYSAEDTRLGRRVAVKLLPRESARDPRALERFQREVRAASALNHPGICILYDVGERDGQPFLVMELLEVQSLKDLLTAGPLRIDHLLNLGAQIASAVTAAHAKGIIHRDVKLANIFVTNGGQVKI